MNGRRHFLQIIATAIAMSIMPTATKRKICDRRGKLEEMFAYYINHVPTGGGK